MAHCAAISAAAARKHSRPNKLPFRLLNLQMHPSIDPSASLCGRREEEKRGEGGDAQPGGAARAGDVEHGHDVDDEAPFFVAQRADERDKPERGGEQLPYAPRGERADDRQGQRGEQQFREERGEVGVPWGYLKHHQR